MNFPFVTRRKYDVLWKIAKQLSEENIRLQLENNTIINNACREKHKFDDWQEIERGQFETIYSNLRAALKEQQ